jgi:hypothetical protein
LREGQGFVRRIHAELNVVLSLACSPVVIFMNALFGKNGITLIIRISESIKNIFTRRNFKWST